MGYHHTAIGLSDGSLRCRLASVPSSTEASTKAARSVCAILEADAEALREANGFQEIVSINLESPEHYCSPAFWKARIHCCLTNSLLTIIDSLKAGSQVPPRGG